MDKSSTLARPLFPETRLLLQIAWRIRRVYNVLEGMTPPVGGGRCAVLALGHWGSDWRSAARARRQRVAQVILRYRCRRRGRCRPPRRRAASGVPVQMRRAPIIKSAKSGPAPSISCAHALTPLTCRCAAPKAHGWAQHARSRLALAHLTAARSRQWRSLHRRPLPPGRRGGGGVARRRTHASHRTALHSLRTLWSRCTRPPHTAVGPRRSACEPEGSAARTWARSRR